MTTRLTQLAHDGFARASLYRREIPLADRRACAWCGSAPGKYEYQWESDGSTQPAFSWRPFGHTAGRGFCSRSCFSSFHS